MSEPHKDKDQEKGDEVLRRLLKTPPDHKTGKGKVDGQKRPTNPQKDTGHADSNN